MFGGGFPCSLPLCPQPIMCPYDVPVPQPCPCPYPVPQPYLQNMIQPVDVPIQNTIQPVIIPTPVCMPVPQPVPVPFDRPCAVPVPQPIPVPVDRPCAVPVPVCVPVPQPCAVPQPFLVREQVGVPVPVPVPVPQPMPYCVPQYVQPEYVCQEEYYEEPICIKRRRRHHHHHHHHHRHRRRTCPAPLPPIIIPVPIQGPSYVEQPQLQVTEYVQDIYPPAQVITDQVPVGYITKNSVIQEPAQIQNQQSLNCQQGVIVPSSSCIQQPQQQLMQQLPNGQLIQRPLSVGGGGVQRVLVSQQSILSPSNSMPTSSPYLCSV